jgi:hypothetical protein
MIRRLDPVGRTAFGLLCIAGMLLEAVPVLIVVGVLGGLGVLIIGHIDRALWVWLGSWIAAGFSGVLFVLLAYLFWPLASDWITEWQGYVMGFVIGGLGLIAMSLVVKLSDWPLAVELIIPLIGTFLVGFLLPGWFLGLAHPQLRTLDHRRQRRVRRREVAPPR